MENKSTQITLISLFCLAAVACCGMWGFLVNKSYAYRRDAGVIAQEIADASIQASRDDALKSSLEGAQKSLGDITGNFMREGDIPAFISSLEGLARSLGVVIDINSIGLAAAREDGAPRKLSLRLSSVSSWKDGVRLISAIDALPYAVDIGDVSLDGGKEGWRLSIDVTQYVI